MDCVRLLYGAIRILAGEFPTGTAKGLESIASKSATPIMGNAAPDITIVRNPTPASRPAMAARAIALRRFSAIVYADTVGLNRRDSLLKSRPT